MSGSCYCCAILLKKTPDDPGNSKKPDPLGVFWVKRPPGPAPSESLELSHQTFLASKGYVGVCLACARGLTNDAEAHAAKCRRWLRLAAPLSTSGLIEARRHAFCLLEPAPDYGRGLNAKAATKTKDPGAGAAVPFGEPRLEGWAFPALGLREASGWRVSDGDVRHYTFSRLRSPAPANGLGPRRRRA